MKTKAERLGGRKRPNHLSFSESSRVLSKETFSTCEMCDMVLKMTVISPQRRHASGAKRNFKALSAWVNFTGDVCCRWLTCQLDCDDRAGQERGGRQWRKRSQILIKKMCYSAESLLGLQLTSFLANELHNRLVGRLFFRLIGLNKINLFYLKNTQYSTFWSMSFKKTEWYENIQCLIY